MTCGRAAQPGPRLCLSSKGHQQARPSTNTPWSRHSTLLCQSCAAPLPKHTCQKSFTFFLVQHITQPATCQPHTPIATPSHSRPHRCPMTPHTCAWALRAGLRIWCPPAWRLAARSLPAAWPPPASPSRPCTGNFSTACISTHLVACCQPLLSLHLLFWHLMHTHTNARCQPSSAGHCCSSAAGRLGSACCHVTEASLLMASSLRTGSPPPWLHATLLIVSTEHPSHWSRLNLNDHLQLKLLQHGDGTSAQSQGSVLTS